MTWSCPRVKFPPSIKKKRKSASKDKLDANYENEHKCDPTQIETIDPNCRFRSQSAHRPRLVLIGDFPVTHSFLQSSHLVMRTVWILWPCIVGHLAVVNSDYLLHFAANQILSPSCWLLIPFCTIAKGTHSYFWVYRKNFILDDSLCSENYVSLLPSFLHLAASKPKWLVYIVLVSTSPVESLQSDQ